MEYGNEQAEAPLQHAETHLGKRATGDIIDLHTSGSSCQQKRAGTSGSLQTVTGGSFGLVEGTAKQTWGEDTRVAIAKSVAARLRQIRDIQAVFAVARRPEQPRMLDAEAEVSEGKKAKKAERQRKTMEAREVEREAEKE